MRTIDIDTLKRYFEIYKCQDKKFIKELEDSTNEIYWDYNDELSDEQINKILNGKKDDVQEEIWENNIDYGTDNEFNIIKEALSSLNIELDNDVEIWDLRDWYSDYVPGLDINLSSLMRNITPSLRIIMFTNYDCLPSHYMHDYGNGYTYDDYLKDIIDLFNLNPALVKKEMLAHNWDVKGSWPNKKNRNGKEYVKYSDFIIELENNLGCSLINFFGTTDLDDFLNNQNIKEITITKGSYAGLLDHSQGGGSVWEMKILRDLTIKLDVPYTKDKCKYNTFELVTDEDNGYGYGANEIAGVSSDFWKAGGFILK